MRKMDMTFLFGDLMSTCALNVVVPMGNPNGGGDILMMGDPHSPEEWD